MTTFGELLSQYDDDEIKERLFEIFPDQRKNEKGYDEALDELRQTRVEVADFVIRIDFVSADDDPFSDEDWLHVHGYKEDEDEFYAIGFSPWEEWIGASIDDKALDEYGELDIVARCVFELTWCGFTNRAQQNCGRILIDGFADLIASEEWEEIDLEGLSEEWNIEPD